MPSQVLETQWSQLSECIADRMGLHFPRERRNDLQRGFAGAVQEFGFADPAPCIAWLLAAGPTKAQLQVLANHLTVGETYFYRDRQTLQALAEHILPELIRSRRGREQRLRLWSAACCSGEEAYSLAILLHQILPDLQNWQVTITATDINAHFLQKAVAGVYSEWSFRAAPAWLKQRYFNRTADGRYAIVPEIKKLVRFAQLNLVEDVYPSLATDTNAMDVILCRNVLMYFTPSQARKVIGKLRLALADNGWLAASPSEASTALFPRFVNANFSGAILFQKRPAPPPPEPTPLASARLPEFGADDPALEPSLPRLPSAALAASTERSPSPAEFPLLARALANQGKLADALTWCDRWIDADKLEPAGHYLRAVVLLERGDLEQARSSFQRAIYLCPDFVLAHFALGNLARACGKTAEANRHLTNALRLLGDHQQNDLLPEADSLTAGRLKAFITSTIAIENTP
ncbi:CheR family methyltransferase [Collimonas silvisoli]|uniref:CheR family methyltransferase n=1 Tax=Collimonas silvisoli TaxID=2825884 RepID=UPI001B8DA277|nr:protein-glutamate O-methyltransferase CheR [Collimonas silvisoli]